MLLLNLAENIKIKLHETNKVVFIDLVLERRQQGDF